MTAADFLTNSVKLHRQERGWSQEELAERAGISRAAVSAIEGKRLVPSVATALSLARVFGCAVESLFGGGSNSPYQSNWAWEPPQIPWRYWQAEVSGVIRLFPVERTGEGNFPHDGVSGAPESLITATHQARETLVVACCDPAAGILATEYGRRTGMRMLIVNRSSRKSLDLLKNQVVHVAGVHFSSSDHQEGNESLVRETLGDGFCLVRAAGWQEGIVLSTSLKTRTVKGLVSSKLRWIGREVGSGARRCLDELLKPEHPYEHLAADHRGVSDAIRAGWADAGVCVQLVGEEAGLPFLPVVHEAYDLCFPSALQHDPRIQGLLGLLQSSTYRKVIGELPGYDTEHVGSLRNVSCPS